MHAQEKGWMEAELVVDWLKAGADGRDSDGIQIEEEHAGVGCIPRTLD